MKLNGRQAQEIADFADGGNVTLSRTKGQSHIDVRRAEDGMMIRVRLDGTISLLSQLPSEPKVSTKRRVNDKGERLLDRFADRYM